MDYSRSSLGNLLTGRKRFLARPRSITKPLRILPLQTPLGSPLRPERALHRSEMIDRMSAVRFTSKAEQLVAAGVRAVVADLVVGETVRDPLGDLVLALEYYAGEVAEEWLYGDCFDGIIIVGTQKSSELGLAIRGTGILITDQTEIAIWLDVRAAPDSDRIVAGRCRLGIPDDDTGELVRVPFGAREALRERALACFVHEAGW